MIPCLLLAAAMAVNAPAPPKGKDPLGALKGEWVVTAAELFGRPDELHVGDTLSFDGDTMTHGGRGGGQKYQVMLDPKAGRIDWRSGCGPWSRRGVYRLSGDTLTLCVASPLAEGDRAGEFRTKAGRAKGDAAGTVLLVLKRKRM